MDHFDLQNKNRLETLVRSNKIIPSTVNGLIIIRSIVKL